MTKRVRTLTACLALTAGALVPTAPARAGTTVSVGGGSGIIVQVKQTSTGASGDVCTLTAVGHDAAGNLVGLSNAHCFIDSAGGKLVGDQVYFDTTPAGTTAAPAPTNFDPGPSLAIGPIGVVTYVSTPNDYLTGGPHGLDYAVIRLDPSKVTPTDTVSSPSGSTTISSTGPVPAFGTRMCKQGHRTGLTCGATLGADDIWYTTLIWTESGDSGSPVVNGTTLTGIAWGLQHFTPITSVLADMNAQGGVGTGFHVG